MKSIVKRDGLLNEEEIEKSAFNELIEEVKEEINNINNEINKLEINYLKENIKKEINVKADREVIQAYKDNLNKLKSQKGESHGTLKKLESLYKEKIKA